MYRFKTRPRKKLCLKLWSLHAAAPKAVCVTHHVKRRLRTAPIFDDERNLPTICRALENEAVRRELEDAARYWLGLGADGFRLDAVKEFFSGSHAKNIKTLAWFNDFVRSVNPNAILVCEDWDVPLDAVCTERDTFTAPHGAA